MIVDTIVHKKVIVKQVCIINELYLYKCFIFFFKLKIKKIFFLNMKIITYNIIHTTTDTNKVEGSKDKFQETELGDNKELL